MSEFEVLNQVKGISFQTIFVTSYSHYAIKAIRFNALDYLVKLIDLVELRQAIKRFRKNNETKQSSPIVKQALVNLQQKNPEDRILFLPSQEGHTFILSDKTSVLISRRKKVEAKKWYTSLKK